MNSPKQWIARQSRDPFVKQRARDGYRSRAAYKLDDMQRRFSLIKRGAVVLDLGGAPGGWAQVAAKYAIKQSKPAPAAAEQSSPPAPTTRPPRAAATAGRVVSIDLLPIDPIPNVVCIQGDMTSPAVLATLQDAIRPAHGKASASSVAGSSSRPATTPFVDVVLSDMAHPFTGSRTADVARVIALCELALDVAERPEVLKRGGAFVCKFIQGEGDQELRQLLKSKFDKVAYEKPEASRSGSAEGYLVCLGYKRQTIA
ncbi:hypothetical protein HDU87_007217 [Geranomyces variabilis]|uniref:rRNA methyltransferase 2, mitochondrial n=1 Tax=Geranomyces variabilis TaxID=109894 RepID=A0AAD5XKH4_9FUNG|nr:hypothetical protein HDU87_007217 [Geranomyces variabilis]